MLLKLIIYPDAMEVVITIIGALKNEGEEKWRKVQKLDLACRVAVRVRNDHEVDQNLTTDFSAELPTELPTMATMVTMLAALG